ncbi:actin-histidine N-methyltransferase [Tribolium madens]|uniref:actin-histidine N-methyltransferase n=1 Tax=Tribolium madens TaxID=41895 RepID=UPI001CF72A99|nr:actin-histidine N-methyltransferase [Tribolium madens]
MGRKNKVSKISQPVKSKTQRNLTPSQLELEELIDKLLRISTLPQQPTVQKSLENQKEISNITERVKKLEVDKDAKSSVDNRAIGATVGNFMKWASENGAQLNGCSIEEFEGYGLGVKANVDIAESSLVIAVPRKLMMSVENAKESILKDLIEKDKILGSMPNVTLAIFLLLEKFKGDSFWKPYIDILPKKYTTVLYFSIDELEELRGSPTLEIALKQIKSISRQYAYFYKLFATSDDPVSKIMRTRFSYTEYCWAVSTVMTRQNTIPFQENYYALIPLWDMCNHTNGTISTAYNPVLDRSECLAVKNFKAGEQLFIFYGSRSNADLFVHNGFVFENNDYDCYWIRLGISKSDPLQQKRNHLLSKLSISSTCDFSIRKGAKPIDGQLLAFLRVFNMNEEQLDHWINSDKSADLGYIDCALDTALEAKSWRFLHARLKLLLSTYKTTLEEDEKFISEAQATPNRLMAIKMRTTEKRIIRETLEYVEQYIQH